MKDLKIGQEKDEIFTLPVQSLINLKYIIECETVRDPLLEIAELDLTYTPEIIFDIHSINSNTIEKSFSVPSTVSLLMNEKESSPVDFGISLKPCDEEKRQNKNIACEDNSPAIKGTVNSNNVANMPSFNKSRLSPSKRRVDATFSTYLNVSPSNVQISSNQTPPSLFKLSKDQRKVSVGSLNLSSLVNAITNQSSYGLLESNFSNDGPNDIYSSDYISKLKYTDIEYDTFCQSIFVSGLSFYNVNVIPESEDYPAPCGHSDCAILCAFRPEILYSYQNEKKNYQINITNLTSNLCFPLGIKLCYSCVFEDEKATNLPLPYNSFMNIITNERGERFFTVTVHYFKKLSFKQFEKEYKLSPIKEFVQFKNLVDTTDENSSSPKNSRNNLNTILEKKMSDSLQIISKFIVNDDILIPECITLVSRFPYIRQMETCLKTILHLEREEMNVLIGHMINEIPVPPQNKKIIFYIPRTPTQIEIFSPFMKDHPTLSLENKILFDYFSIENIIFIFHLILLEQKILFIDNDYSTLSDVSLSFISLIYPFIWVNTYIPVLSLTTVKFLQSIIPFIMGIDECLFKIAKEKQYIDQDSSTNQIIYVHIRKNYIDISSNKKGKKMTIKSIMKALILPEMPEPVVDELQSELKSLKKIFDEKKTKTRINYSKVEKTIREIFTKAMVMMIGDYNSSMFMTEDEMPLFNNEGFLSHRNKNNKLFYQELIVSQLFNQFLLNEGKWKIGGFLKGESHYGWISDNMSVDTGYFHQLCVRYKGLINSLIIKNRSRTRSSSVSQKALVLPEGKPGDTASLNANISLNKSIKDESMRVETVNNSMNATTMSNTPNIPSRKGNTEANANDSDDNETNQYDTFLVVPYFIQHPLVRIDTVRIEEFLSDSNYTKPLLANSVTPHYIITGHNDYNMNTIKDCFRRYFIKTETEDIMHSNSTKGKNKNNTTRSNKRSSSSSTQSKFNQIILETSSPKDCFSSSPDQLCLAPAKSVSCFNPGKNSDPSITFNSILDLKKGVTEVNSHEMKNNIMECYRSICTSEPIKAVHFLSIETALLTSFGRDYFVLLISQTEESSHKLLSAYSFNDMLRLVLFTFGHFTDEEFENIQRLTRTLMCYYKYIIEYLTRLE